jgi:hypothetical protein
MNILELAKQTKALADEATPGPWKESLEKDWHVWNDSERCVADCGKERHHDLGMTASIANASFIVHTRSAAPQLADAVIEMVDYLEELRDWDDSLIRKSSRALLTKLGIEVGE